MRTVRLAELLAVKYKYAINAVDLEASLRKKIPVLWNYPNKLFDILKACANAGITNAKSPEERKAYSGYKFCKELVSIIDYLKVNWLNISLPELKDKLNQIVELINSNKEMKFGPGGKPAAESAEETPLHVQFPHVAELIYAITPLRKKHDKTVRDGLQAKARTGLSRILSFSLSMLEELNQLEMMEPQKFVGQKETDSEEPEVLPKRFEPQRAQLTTHDIIDFIRQHGDEYGIDSTEDWNKLFVDDPVLRGEMTTVINAINRGHYPRGAHEVKTQINDILGRHKERAAASNAHLFEDTENQ